jgi:ferritin-like metal-binding protein YciE
MAKSKSSGRAQQSPDASELLVLELQEIHSAESQLARVLPRLSKAAESKQLQSMLDVRLKQGGRLLSEIESALEELDETPGRKKNVAAEGLINDAREHVQEIEQGPALDAVLIAAIQKTEHYCIASWGTARSLAQATGQKKVVKVMEQALKEGSDVDEKLTELAESEITPALLEGTSESDEDAEDEDDSAAAGGRSAKKSGGSERRTST